MTVAEAIRAAAGVPLAGDPVLVAQEGDVGWYIAALDDGRWAATDEAEIHPERVQLFPSLEAALTFQRAGWLLSHPDAVDTIDRATSRFGWFGVN